jgi:PAS domain S-box-containing protein
MRQAILNLKNPTIGHAAPFLFRRYSALFGNAGFVMGSVLLGLLIGFPLLLPLKVSAQAPTRRVLILSSYDPNRPALTILNQAIRSTIRDGSQGRVEFYYEFQENTRIPNEMYESEMVSLLRRKYEEEDLSLIIALGAPALKFLLKHEPELFTETPKVFYSHDEREETVRSLWPHVTGVYANLELDRTLDIALALHPDTENVVVVSGNSAQDKFYKEEAQRDFQTYQDKAKFIYLDAQTIQELQEKVSALPKKSIVIYLSFLLDKAGNSFSGVEALSLISPKSSAPIYGIPKTYMGSGIVGGSLLDFEALGKRTGEMSLRVMNGEKPQDLRPQTAPNVLMFDWRQLQRWGVSEQRVPPGSVIRFKEPTFWQLYQWYIVGIVAAFIIESLLIVWLVSMRSKRRQAETKGERLALLAEAEHRRLEEVVLTVPGVVWEVRIDPASNAHKTTFVSEHVENILGYTVEEWLSIPDFCLKIVHDEDRERVIRECEDIVASKEGGSLQFRWVAKDGHVLWVEGHLALMKDESGKITGMRGVTMDITHQRSAEEAKQQSEERNRAILEAIPDLMFLQTSDGTYLDFYASDSADLLVAPEDFLGKNMWDVLPAKLAEDLSLCFKRVEETGAPQVHEYALKIGDADRWFEARVVGCGHDKILSVVRDVTERKQSEEALRQSEERFRTMADTAPVMIWISGDDRLCTYFNQQWLDFTGRTMQQELGNGWAEGVHPDDRARCREIYTTSFNDRKRFAMEYRIRHADGEYRWVLDCGTPRFSSEGEFLGYIGSGVDITERKELEEERRKALEELNQLKNQLEAENIYLQQELEVDQSLGEIVGQSDALKYVRFKINQVAPTDSTVLIMGETGTGKELVARAIHRASTRGNRTLIKVNCAVLSASLIESELFGHEKGAFTGAVARKIGRFELADGGTIFLDEIGELPLELQVKLLRVFQEGEFERLGGTKTIKIDVRIIAATNRNLKLEVEKGTFRQDLWYRLNVFPITVPPLRQRKEDIPALVDHFVGLLAKRFGKRITSVSTDTMRHLQGHSWPGNVRELANVIERAVIHTRGSVLHLADSFEQSREDVPSSTMSLEEMEREYILRTLESTGWRIEGPYGAAKILGLNPSTLRTRMAKLHIQRRRTSVA